MVQKKREKNKKKMLEKIENRLNKRKQRGRKQFKSRVNITYPINSIAIYANKDIEMKIEIFKQLKTDLTKLVSGFYNIIFSVLPNKPFTKKGILVRMGKGKGKINNYSIKVKAGTICIKLINKLNNIKEEEREAILDQIKYKIKAKYTFLSFKSFFL